mmetsp:Transcript_10279/g.20487  ORF Transcript_10279/g.20487 Transcript_10279/m.20487 type:complete len:84 (+) Transcript_10279:23-274(+)
MSHEAGREPCPYRIFDDMGVAFTMGAVGGGIFHSIQGARHSPPGSRLAGSLLAVEARGPVLDGNFAIWGALYASFGTTIYTLR